MSLMPVLFVGHGSPMNAIEDNEFSKSWKDLSKRIPKPKYIICISAHWLREGTAVTGMNKPKTIHDFYGFPEKLYLVEYKAKGSKDLAQEIKNLVREDSISIDNEGGLDHGTWSILKNMYPNADIPVVQLSLNYQISPQKAYEIGKELKKLREEGVLIIGSGNIVHNLMVMGDSSKPYAWAEDFDNEIKNLILKEDHKKLIDYTKLPNSIKAHPTNDHYLPLLYALGAAGESKASFFTEEIVFGSISMRSVLFEE